MKLAFTIYGIARPQGRARAVALDPQGGKALREQACGILDFFGNHPLPAKERAVVEAACTLRARAHVYDPPASRDWKNTLRWHLLQHRQNPLLDGAIVLTVIFVFPVPKSYPKRIREAVARGEMVPVTTKPDGENLLRPVKDACKGLIWRDDAQVYDGRTIKVYGSPPRVEVVLEVVDGKP